MRREFIVSWIAMSVGAIAFAEAPKVDERHAEFTLANISDGKPATLADFRGKKVLLIQFTSW